MRTRIRRAWSRTLPLVLALVAWSAAATVAAKPPVGTQQVLIIQVSPGQIKKIAARNQLTVLQTERDLGGDDLALVSLDAAGTPEQTAAALVARETAIKKAEPLREFGAPDVLASAPVEQSPGAILEAAALEGTIDLGVDPHGEARELWIGFADQPSSQIIRLGEAHSRASGKDIVIAVIDSAIDTEHPVLASQLLEGRDFFQDQGNGSLRNNGNGNGQALALLDQSTMAILDQRTRAVLMNAGGIEAFQVDPSTSVLVEAGVGSELAGQIGPAFGHGTMVAGIIHLVAPRARILPLRAFDADGNGNTFDAVQAIHYAAREGAKVINLSFTLDDDSETLANAIAYALSWGAICVASAGNDGSSVVVYPAAAPGAIGVAATDLADFVASFSNYGGDVVELAAPGVSVITTYPGGTWAAASGTSFSTPWVSGAIALLAQRAAQTGVPLDLDRALAALSHSAEVNGALALEVGYGRLNVIRALENLSLEPSVAAGNGNQ